MILILTSAAVLSSSGCGKQESGATTPRLATVAPSQTEAAVPVHPQRAAPIKTYDGPFGLAMGIPPSELVGSFQFKQPTSDSPNVYEGQPPKAVDGFDTYYVFATNEQGICRIMAVEDVGVVNDSGMQLKEKVDELAETLGLKYGKHTKKYDFSTQDVYRRNPEFWMMGLREGAVAYAYDWESGKNNLLLPNDISSIEVSANSTRSNSGWVRVMYVFKNSLKCDVQIKKRKSSNL